MRSLMRSLMCSVCVVVAIGLAAPAAARGVARIDDPHLPGRAGAVLEGHAQYVAERVAQEPLQILEALDGLLHTKQKSVVHLVDGIEGVEIEEHVKAVEVANARASIHDQVLAALKIDNHPALVEPMPRAFGEPL